MAQPAFVPVTDRDARARILDAAEELFASLGYEGAGISAVASRAGVAKATVFHHFASKQALYQSVVRAAIDESQQHLQEPEVPGEISVMVARFAEAHLTSILMHPRLARLLLREMHAEPHGPAIELAEAVFHKSFGKLVELLQHGQKGGELKTDIDPAVLAAVLVGADVFFFQARSILSRLPGGEFTEDPARFSRQLVELLLRGARATPGNHCPGDSASGESK